MLLTSRPRHLAALTLALLSAIGWASPSLAQTEPPPQDPEAGVVHSWALAPAGNDGGAGDRPNMSYELAPGTEAKDGVTLFNYSNVQLTFDLYATDAFNNADGAFALLAGDKTPTDVGAWISLEQNRITVPPRTQATFPIVVRVPPDARPGDHAGAILAASKALGTGPDNKVVELDRRTGSRIYVRVAGPLDARLVVERLRTAYNPSLNPLAGAATVSYRITNTGNIRLTGTARTSVGGPLGLLAKDAPPEALTEILPGESVQVTKKLRNVSATGLAFTKVDVVPLEVQGGAGVDPEPTSRSTLSLAFPFTILALAIVALLVRRALRSFKQHGRDDLARPHPA